MEIKPLYAVIALVAVFLALLAASQLMAAPAPAAPNYAAEAEAIYMKGAETGANASAYTYAYTEYSNGFAENYTLEYDGSISSVEVSSILSDRKLYFLENDTILCVDFAGASACSSVKNVSGAAAYVEDMRDRLFDPANIEVIEANYAYMYNKSILVFSPDIQDTVLPDGRECDQIEYTIDYQNITLADMSRLGVTAATPRLFQFVSCVGMDGVIDQLYFNYTYQGAFYTVEQNLISADFTRVPVISPPQNLSGDAFSIASDENTARNDLFQCYLSQPEGDARGTCIQNIALELSDKDLCDAAGTVRDRCLVSFMPYIRDPSVCTEMTMPEFTDDCYIELAGAYKNSTWCSMVNDTTKRSYCLQIASQSAAENETTAANTTGSVVQGPSGNESAVPAGVAAIFNAMENESTGPANSTGSANATG
jgi:hypothetical protein